MKELLKNEHYKVIKVEFAAGTNMPRHLATPDAFVIVERGSALLIYKGETLDLMPGATVSIQANEQHMLKIIDDFSAYIILAGDAAIHFVAA